ncbi:hypothetical protein ACTVZO_36325 [Streptomyces sp. IBSNAI002]|uniref:hypothetical protein n=1 Tax=Streptomyces sp. IBSNAI002 TaxID=3457500 RepID=UPI003FD315F6
MICPNCSTSLRARERRGQVCSRCHRRFALDPKVHGRGMHDVRIRRRAAALTHDGRLTVTVTQLWYRCRTYSRAWPAREAHGTRPWVRRLVSFPICAGFLVCWALTSGFLALLAAAAAVGVLIAAHNFLEFFSGGPAGSYIRPDEEEFRKLMSGEWTTVYGELPPGVVDDGPRTAGHSVPQPHPPRAVILCTDHAVAVFLEANGLPARLRAVLVEADPGSAHDALVDVPGRLPVVVLHDASALGALLAPLLRVAHPDRAVVDAGLPVAAVRSRGGAVHRVTRVPSGSQAPAVDAGGLRDVAGLSEEDAVWLAEGFWSPIAAVPPALLAGVVEEAVERAVAGAAGAREPDPAYGFLTWPDAPATKGTPTA